MIQQEKIGKHTVYVAEFGSGDIALVPASNPPKAGPELQPDNMLWLIQDEPKPEDQWNKNPVLGAVNSDDLNGEPMPIMLRFNNSKSMAVMIGILMDMCSAMEAKENLDKPKKGAIL